MYRCLIALILIVNINSLASNGNENYLENIPQELLRAINEHLEWKDLYNLSTTSKALQIANNYIWQGFFKEYLGDLQNDDLQLPLKDEKDKVLKDNKGNDIIDWMTAFINTFAKVLENNKAYVLKYKNLPNTGDEKRDKLLMFADFSNTDLDNANLEKANLYRANLTKAIFKKAKLNGANLDKANLTSAKFIQTGLNGAHLEGANLTHVNMILCEVKNANLSFAFIENARLTQSKFNNAIFKSVRIFKSNLGEAIFDEVDFTNAKFNNIDVSNTSFKKAFIMEGESKQFFTLSLLQKMTKGVVFYLRLPPIFDGD